MFKLQKLTINLKTNKMTAMSIYGEIMNWNLNEENFPKWVDLEKMKIKSTQNDFIVYTVNN